MSAAAANRSEPVTSGEGGRSASPFRSGRPHAWLGDKGVYPFGHHVWMVLGRKMLPSFDPA